MVGCGAAGKAAWLRSVGPTGKCSLYYNALRHSTLLFAQMQLMSGVQFLLLILSARLVAAKSKGYKWKMDV